LEFSARRAGGLPDGFPWYTGQANRFGATSASLVPVVEQITRWSVIEGQRPWSDAAEPGL